MKKAIVGLALLLAAGCYGESVHPPAEPQDQAGNEGTQVTIDPKVYEIATSELGTNRTHPIAKTIEWPGISSQVGDTYHEERAVIDQILRDDSDDNYGVRVRLKNTTKTPLKMEFLIRFYTRSGGRVMSYVGHAGVEERWTGFMVEPLKYTTVSDFARVHGAEGFRLFIRGAGSKLDGMPDDPAKREERRKAREASGEK
jgi:hypothetical protein